jgi:hypothetical protein
VPSETNIVEIENGVARLVTRTIRREVLEDELLANLGKLAAFDLPFVPECALTYWAKGDLTLVARQDPPQTYSLNWRDGDREASFNVPLPWLQWWAGFKSGRQHFIALTATTRPVTGLEDQLRLPPLPNIYTDRLVVCVGNAQVFNGAPWPALAQTRDSILASEWNSDLAPDWAGLGLMLGNSSRDTPQARGVPAIWLSTYGLGLLAMRAAEGVTNFYDAPTGECTLLRDIPRRAGLTPTFEGLRKFYINKLSALQRGE